MDPLADKGFWDKALKKFKDRAREWGRLGLGFCFASLSYSVYILPVLSFLAQFRKPCEKALQAEEEALRMLVPGPWVWCRTSDLYLLSSKYEQARDFASLSHLSLAARARLFKCENSSRGA